MEIGDHRWSLFVGRRRRIEKKFENQALQNTKYKLQKAGGSGYSGG